MQDILPADGKAKVDEFQQREARLIEGVRGLEAQARACSVPDKHTPHPAYHPCMMRSRHGYGLATLAALLRARM